MVCTICCVHTILRDMEHQFKMGWPDGYDEGDDQVRSAIEPAIGHMKIDGRLNRNPLKGALGDALHAVMCGVGHNMRKLLRKLRLFCTRIGVELQEIWRLISMQRQPIQVCVV